MENVKQKIDTLGGLAVLGTGFAVPLSTSLVTVFSSLAVLLWFVRGRFIEAPRVFLENPIVRVALLLFFWLLVGVFYSSSSLTESFDILKKYRELILILVFVSLLRHSRLSKWGMYTFLIGACVLLALSYFSKITGIELSRFGATPISTITHNFFMAFATFWAVHEFFNRGKYQWLWGGLAVLATLNIFTMIIGRTGQVVFIALFLLLVLQRLDLKKQAVAAVSLAILLGVFLRFSDTFSARIAQVGTDLQAYDKSGHADYDNSVGLRLEWWENSLELISEKPVFGYGTGSFPEVYRKLAEEKGLIRTDNPHNEYLLIIMQAGIPGLALFLYLFYLMWIKAHSLETQKMWLAQGLVLSMTVGCLFNSFLLDSLEGHFFAYFAAIFFVNCQKGDEEQPIASSKIKFLNFQNSSLPSKSAAK